MAITAKDVQTLREMTGEGKMDCKKAPTEAEARDLIAPVEEELRDLLGDVIYGADVKSLEEVAFALMEAQGLTFGTAESCTGGLVAKRMTDLPGASAVLKGGVVSYTDEVKHNVLGVPQALLDQYGAVSPQVAEAMARGTRRVLGCDLAVSTTGVQSSGEEKSSKEEKKEDEVKKTEEIPEAPAEETDASSEEEKKD